ncbi:MULTISPECIES: arsenate reductase family protein [Enterococcus]|uniref:Arsenate reductase family protein n=1 Tax=Enterococcus entomosocium TaxID=3034352 RepID=A0ABV3MGX4_9ENTE|nr:arsenate reductase family protein [Enterococcus casseliflavus]MBE9895240.1 arsenate reductase family protein [Enterococcus casseliflavus]MDB1709625.1 arsenate reductase family protein [Enterococcus casseliflavus]MDB1715007.1 arsenate reductase family protein [Enterococcus casseliflavus]UOO45202.1 arsenate reductase family protein [Enterococcus casseliflavus]
MITFYWYPKCSTCRNAKRWLEEHEIPFEAIDMVATPPQPEQLLAWINSSDAPLTRFFNTSGMKYRELQLKEKVPTMTAQDAADVLATDGMLIKRPLLVSGDRFLINGFKENEYEGVLLESWKRNA